MSASTFDADLVAILPHLKHAAMRLTRHKQNAEDLVHEAVASALASRHTFAPGTNFRAWLNQILRHRWINDFRRHSAREGRGELVGLDAADLSGLLVEPAAQMAGIELREVTAAIALLPPAQRSALVDLRIRGVPPDDYAACRGISPVTAKTRLHRAIQTLHARGHGPS